MPIYVLLALCVFNEPSSFTVPPMWKVENITTTSEGTALVMTRKLPRSEVVVTVPKCTIIKREAIQHD